MLHGQVGRMEVFMTSPHWWLLKLHPLFLHICVPPLCTCTSRQTHTQKKSQGDTGVCKVLHSSQLNSRCSETISIWGRGSSFLWKTETNGRLTDTEVQRQGILIWIVFLKNNASLGLWVLLINIHLFEKWKTCWKTGKTPGRECKYPEPGDFYQ